MLHRLIAVIRREYLERIRSKAFWLSTLVMPLFLATAILVPTWLAERGGGDFRIALLDLTGRLAKPIEIELDKLLSGVNENLSITLLPQEPGNDPDTARETLKQRVLGQEFDGLLVLPAALPDEGQPQYVAPNVSAFRLLTVLEQAVNKVLVADRLTRAGVDPGRVEEYTRRAGLEAFKLGEGGEETRDKGQGFILSYGFVIIIYLTVLMYGIYVMRGVLEEKSSHIVEIIISTVKPFELMLGKIVGIGAVGLTQFLIWTVVIAANSSPAVVALLGYGFELPRITVQFMVFFAVYFILGFLLYGAFYAAIGAAFETEQEAQYFQSIVTYSMLVPMSLMMVIFNQPNSALSVGLSMFPFFAPMLMVLRMTLVQVPPLQIFASVVTLLVAIFLCTWMTAKIYRVGILMSGSKPTFKDLWRWARES